MVKSKNNSIFAFYMLIVVNLGTDEKSSHFR